MNIEIGIELVTERVTWFECVGIWISISLIVLIVGAIIFDKIDERRK